MILHNKYFEVLEKYVGDYTKGIYGRELIGKVSLSQKSIALALEELEKESILRSHKRGTIKLYELNISNSEIKDILLQVELNRKIGFLSKNRSLAHIFNEDDRIIGVFGSYASGTEKEHPDVDVFVIGNKRKDDYDKLGKKIDMEISIKYFSQKAFKSLLKDKNSLCKEIIRNHIIIFGTECFIKVVWRYYYGFA